MTDETSFTVYWSHYDRFRLWLHGKLYRPVDFIPFDGALLIKCSCGGFAHVRRNDDGTSAVGEVTCALWVRIKRIKSNLPLLPVARTVRR